MYCVLEKATIKESQTNFNLLQVLPWWHGSWGIVDLAWWFCTHWFLRRGRGAGRGATGRWTARRSSRLGRPREQWPGSAGERRWPRKEPPAHRTRQGTWSGPKRKHATFCYRSKVTLRTRSKTVYWHLWSLTWCSLRDIRIPGTTTFLSSSMSAKIHSSRIEEMRKSPLNNAWSP